VFVTVHRPAADATRRRAVIICPPFGWEEVCSYRSRRLWAQTLAEQGYTALRLSLPGTGDSGGAPTDAGLVEAWIGAVAGAAGWARARAGARQVTAIGIGLGGMLAWLATAQGAPIDDLVLWGTPSRGRALVRQLRAFATLENAQIDPAGEHPPELPDGALEAGGFLLGAETAARLQALDLASQALPHAAGRRVLLLARDGIAADAALGDALAGAGVEVTTDAGDGYADMTSHPQYAVAPLAVLARVGAWLESAPAHRDDGDAGAVNAVPARDEAAVESLSSARIATATNWVIESPVTIALAAGTLSGVLCEPERRDGPAPFVVLLNPGATRRIGPDRMWVEAARRWADLGVGTLRLDVEAIGDADGDERPYVDDGALYAPSFVPQVLAALDFLRARGIGGPFVLGGLCSGAYWSLHAGLADPDVCAMLLINPRALIWEEGLDQARDLRRLLSGRLTPATLRSAVTVRRLRAFVRWLVAAPLRLARRLPAPRASAPDVAADLDTLLDALIESGRRALFLFSDNEPVEAELIRSGRAGRLSAAPAIAMKRIAVRDHTLRPLWAQREAHAALDAAIELELELMRSPPAPAASPAPAPPGARAETRPAPPAAQPASSRIRA
jgi:alpha/beta superfamily hydrolase